MEKKQIAIAIMERMRARAVAQFFQNGVVLQSQDGEYLHPLTPAQEAQVKHLAEKDMLVYHVIRGAYMCEGNLMEMEIYLIISQEDVDTCCDAQGLEMLLSNMEIPAEKHWEVFVYVKNLSRSNDSEYGYCLVKANGNAGMSRIV